MPRLMTPRKIVKIDLSRKVCGHGIALEGLEECYTTIKGRNYVIKGMPCCIREKIDNLRKERKSSAKTPEG